MTTSVHRNMVMVRMADAAQLEKLLSRASIRSRVIYRLDQRTILVSRSALPAVRKRIAELGLRERLAEARDLHE